MVFFLTVDAANQLSENKRGIAAAEYFFIIIQPCSLSSGNCRKKDVYFFYLLLSPKTAPAAKSPARTANSGAGLAVGACVSADAPPFPMIWMRPAGLA